MRVHENESSPRESGQIEKRSSESVGKIEKGQGYYAKSAPDSTLFAFASEASSFSRADLRKS